MLMRISFTSSSSLGAACAAFPAPAHRQQRQQQQQQLQHVAECGQQQKQQSYKVWPTFGVLGGCKYLNLHVCLCMEEAPFCDQKA
jgi:hypothetical protein